MADERIVAEMNFTVVRSCILRLLRMKPPCRINAEMYLPARGVRVTNLIGSEFFSGELTRAPGVLAGPSGQYREWRRPPFGGWQEAMAIDADRHRAARPPEPPPPR